MFKHDTSCNVGGKVGTCIDTAQQPLSMIPAANSGLGFPCTGVALGVRRLGEKSGSETHHNFTTLTIYPYRHLLQRNCHDETTVPCGAY